MMFGHFFCLFTLLIFNFILSNNTHGRLTIRFYMYPFLPSVITIIISQSPSHSFQFPSYSHRLYPRVSSPPVPESLSSPTRWSNPHKLWTYVHLYMIFPFLYNRTCGFFLFIFISLLTLQYTSNFIPSYSLFRTFQYIDEEVPEARFSYDLSPMAVLIKKKGKKWYEFVTSMCALIGGTFTVVGLLSSFLNLVFKNKKI